MVLLMYFSWQSLWGLQWYKAKRLSIGVPIIDYYRKSQRQSIIIVQNRTSCTFPEVRFVQICFVLRMHILQTFVRDNKLSFSKHEADRLIKVMEASMIEASRTPKLYGHTGAKKSIVWKYFGFIIKAKDGPATKTNLDVAKTIYKLYRKSFANKVEHPFRNNYE